MEDSLSPKPKMIVRVDTNTVKIVQQYVRQCRLHLPDLRQAASQNDFPLLIQEAHKIKGTGGLMSIAQLSGLGERLELAARANNLNEVQLQLEALSQYLNSITIAA
jgi:HPt (histidine-containing phosphotransfer) domain-containing protein